MRRRAHPKPIPRWDVHFGVLKMTERTPQPLVSPLGPNWVGTDSAGLAICTFHLGFSLEGDVGGLRHVGGAVHPVEMGVQSVSGMASMIFRRLLCWRMVME